MEPKQRLFIYERREMGVLILLGIMVALFAFTLGVHLGKKVGPKAVARTNHETTTAPTVPDQTPNPNELSDQSKAAPQAAEDILNQSLKDEVAHSGIKIDKSRQVELPKTPKTKQSGATHTEETKKAEAHLPTHAIKPEPTELDEVLDTKTAKEAHLAGTKAFALQVGSHQSVEDAKRQLSGLDQAGVKTFLKSVDLKSKGKWYRVYLGEYPSRVEAEQAGVKFKEQHLIDSFIVAKVAH